MLIIHRFAQLGILDDNGIPVVDMGIVAYDAVNVLPLRTRAAGVFDIRPGKRCPECGNHAVIRKEGCDFCSVCDAVRVWVKEWNPARYWASCGAIREHPIALRELSPSILAILSRGTRDSLRQNFRLLCCVSK